MSVSTETLMKAGEESVKFIDNMHPNELGMYTLRKAFEMGYLHGASQAADELKDVEELKDLEAVAADQAMTIAMMKAEKQEPVAWFEYNPDLEAWFLAYHPNTNPKVKTRPLYTAPSQREWVGLTMEDVNELYENYDPSQWYDFLRDVEAKLKEKNT